MRIKRFNESKYEDEYFDVQNIANSIVDKWGGNPKIDMTYYSSKHDNAITDRKNIWYLDNYDLYYDIEIEHIEKPKDSLDFIKDMTSSLERMNQLFSDLEYMIDPYEGGYIKLTGKTSVNNDISDGVKDLVEILKVFKDKGSPVTTMEFDRWEGYKHIMIDIDNGDGVDAIRRITNEFHIHKYLDGGRTGIPLKETDNAKFYLKIVPPEIYTEMESRVVYIHLGTEGNKIIDMINKDYPGVISDGHKNIS